MQDSLLMIILIFQKLNPPNTISRLQKQVTVYANRSFVVSAIIYLMVLGWQKRTACLVYRTQFTGAVVRSRAKTPTNQRARSLPIHPAAINITGLENYIYLLWQTPQRQTRPLWTVTSCSFPIVWSRWKGTRTTSFLCEWNFRKRLWI